MTDFSDLSSFLERFRDPALIARIASRGAISPAVVERMLNVYVNEVPVGLDLVRSELSAAPNARILEIGSGLGILSLYLRRRGLNLTALEPIGSGFSFFEAALPEIMALVPEVDVPLLRIGAEELSADRHGKFDVIFSTNVLEHVPDLPAVFAGMADVLAAEGRMVHLCPNYAIPYEPHFARPLLPFAPSLSRWMVQSASLPGVWESLNFINYRTVRRLAVKNGLCVTFEPGLLSQALIRLGNDAEYASRHQSRILRALSRLAQWPVFRSMLAAIPPSLSTPMRFRLTAATYAKEGL